NHAAELTTTVSQRDLSQLIQPSGHDEITQLETALASMVTGLKQAMGLVRSGSKSIAAASSQISAGNLDLSSRTEQQASSLAETASAMEELTTTVQQNDDRAKQATQLS